MGLTGLKAKCCKGCILLMEALGQNPFPALRGARILWLVAALL